MTVGGWIIMVLSVGFVTLLFGWCLWKVLSMPGSTQHIHSEHDIDTHDTE